MAEQTKVLRSEHTKDMSLEELAELQEKVGQMSEEELKAFRNSMNPDDMGFFGEESVDDDSTKD
jgi:chromosome condensin MukBEF complex kleisin-like MukF subunit